MAWQFENPQATVQNGAGGAVGGDNQGNKNTSEARVDVPNGQSDFDARAEARRQQGPMPGVQITLHGVDMNRYASRKSLAHGCFTMALFVNNITSLERLCSDMEHQHPVQPSTFITAVLFSVSILLQSTVGILCIFLGKTDMNRINDQAKALRRDNLNLAVTVLSFVITIANASANALMRAHWSHEPVSPPDFDYN